MYLVVKLNIPLPFSKIRIITKLKAVFISQNKSILDEDGNDESSVSIKEECLQPEIEAEISFLDISDVKDINLSQEHSVSQLPSSTAESEREVMSLKAELSRAKGKIYLCIKGIDIIIFMAQIPSLTIFLMYT